MDGEVLVDEVEVGKDANKKRSVRGKQVDVGPAANSRDNNVRRKNGASEAGTAE